MTIVRLLSKGVSHFSGNRFETLLTLVGVALITFIGLFLFLVANNIQNRIVADKGEIQFEIYWKHTADPEQIDQQWRELRGMDSVLEVTTYRPEEGLQVLAGSLGGDLDLTWFKGENNPLPPTAVVTFKLDHHQPEIQAKEFAERVETMPGVQMVHYNSLQLDSAGSWLSFSRTILWPLILVLILLVGLIVGNTIKLAQLHFQDEIEVLRLVGAARWYIMLPLLSGGALYALSGGALALGLLKITQESLNELLNRPPLWLRVEYLSWDQVLLSLAILTLVAVIFSWVNVRK